MAEEIPTVRTVTTDDYAIMTVKIISVLGYIMAGLMIIGSFFVMFGGRLFVDVIPVDPATGALAGSALIVVGILMLIIGVVWLFVSRALWNYKNWARITFIIIAVLGIINSIIVFPAGLVMLLIDAAVIYFLAFDRRVRTLFII